MLDELRVLVPSDFTGEEIDEIAAAAQERGITINQLVHDAVMNDLFR